MTTEPVDGANDNLPPRPEEDLAHAEDYRVMQQASNPFAFVLSTPGGRTVHLHYSHGQVTGFPHLHQLDVSAREEITRQIHEMFAADPDLATMSNQA